MTEKTPIRILIVDDHLMVRRGLEIMIQAADDLELVAEAADGDAAVRLCGDVMPDVVLMDMVIPGMDGAAATRAIRQQYPSVQVLALTSYTKEELIHEALRAGAIGFLHKDVDAQDLCHAIRRAAQGQATLSPAATQAVVQAAAEPPRPGRDLTEREVDVLALLATGLPNDAIAAQLNISPSTVKTHVGNIMAKLDASSRTEAVAIALRYDLV